MLVLLVVSSVFVSCDKENERINLVDQNVESRKCPTCKKGWEGVRADVWGGLNGAGTGGFLTGGNPIGIMLGAVAGTVGSSAGWWRAAAKSENLETFPFIYAPDNINLIQNPPDKFGKIHNRILSEVTSDTNLTNYNYDYIYNRSIELIKYEFVLLYNEFTDLNMFKQNFEPSFYALCVNKFSYSIYFEHLNNKLLLSLESDKITTNEEFEQFISEEISEANSTEELLALAIMRHTF